MFATRGGLAGQCAKVVRGDLHEGGGSTIHVYSFIFERGWLKENSVQRHGCPVGLHEGAAYTSEYGIYGIFQLLFNG